jgi:hypothetical protein
VSAELDSGAQLAAGPASSPRAPRGAAPEVNPLDERLRLLENLGLARPPHALVSEYLGALVDEQVLDAAAAAGIADVCHRWRFGSVGADDAAVSRAAASLDAAAAALAAMPAEARGAVCQRVGRRLQPAPGEPRRSGPAPADRPELSGAGGPTAPAGVVPVPRVAEDETPPAPPVPRRRYAVPMELVLVSAVCVLVAGYLLRDAIDAAMDASESDTSARDAKKATPDTVWMHERLFTRNLWRRAELEIENKNEPAAVLIYELLTVRSPRDARAWNDLAWLHLTSKDPAVHDPQRGLELSSRALELARTPMILDTAAEAQFQTGQVAEAVRLEREALRASRAVQAFTGNQSVDFFEKQLAKFEQGRRSRPPTRAPRP